MSRIGKYPVVIPNDVTVALDNDVVKAKGKLGELSVKFDAGHVSVKIEDGKVVVAPLSESKMARALWGTTRAEINTIVKGVHEGFKKNLELIGNARVKQEENEAFADKFHYDAATKMLTATGNTTSNAMMDNGETLTLKANRQEYTQDTNTFNASGNVKVWYQDYFAQGPKIAVYPDKVTKKPNEVYFVGRSSISQGPRTIYADKIRMIINPKDFHAEGNTRTVIKNIGSGGDSDEDMTLGL